MPLEDEIRTYLRTLLRAHAERRGLPPSLVTRHVNLVKAGIVDSLAFLEVVAAVELKFGLRVDFSGRDPDTFTTPAGLAAVCAQSGGRR